MSNNKKNILLLIICFLLMFLCGCKSIVLNSVSNMLSDTSSKNQETNPMVVLTGENDPVLMGDFFPTALKLYEIMHTQNPKHKNLAIMTGSLYVMYANAFIQHKADMLEIDNFDLQVKEYDRAKLHYLRGRDYVFSGLERAYPDFTQDITSGNQDRISLLVKRFKKEDVNALYWAGAAWLGAFSLNPLDHTFLLNITGAVALLERAAELDPSYNDGAIWDILCAFYASALPDMGGGFDKALYAHEQAVKYSDGNSISVWNTYAQSICIQTQDSEGYDNALKKALAIDINANPSTRLASTIAREKSIWLVENKDKFFIEW